MIGDEKEEGPLEVCTAKELKEGCKTLGLSDERKGADPMEQTPKETDMEEAIAEEKEVIGRQLLNKCILMM